VEDRKGAILRAAAELFAAKGFSGVGVDEIGARVGITGPAIYRHFGGKDALLAAVVMETITAFAVADDADHERMVADAVTVALDDPVRLVTYVRERHRLTGEARAVLARGERRLYRPWRDAIRRVNPDLDAEAIALRQRAVLTAMSAVAVATGSPALARPRLERLLVESMVAALTVPPVAVVPLEPLPATGWSVPPTRRDRILTEALRLFRERGYHGVGLDEIGRAAGISGPAVYAHFASKGEILVDAFDRAGVRVAAAVDAAVAGATSASEALDRLAAAYLAIAADHGDLILVTSREAAALAEGDRPRFARRRGVVLAPWVAVVRELRPELGEAAAQAVVGGVLPLMDQMAYGLRAPAEGVPLVRAWCLGRA